jgi:hypothetical protein
MGLAFGFALYCGQSQTLSFFFSASIMSRMLHNFLKAISMAATDSRWLRAT